MSCIQAAASEQVFVASALSAVHSDITRASMICGRKASMAMTVTSVITAMIGNSTCKVSHWPSMATGIVMS